MTPARVAYERLKTLGKFQIFGIVMFAIGGIYVAVLLTSSRLLAVATRLL